MMSGSQFGLLLFAIAAFITGGIASLLQRIGKAVPASLRWTTLLSGIFFCGALLAWHSLSTWYSSGTWQPLQDSLSALLTLALLLAGFVAYVQHKRPIAMLEWLIMPIVVLLLLMAGHFGVTRPSAYLDTTYSLAHRLSAFLGALAFLIAGASGVLYLLSDRNLRARPRSGMHLPPAPNRFGSLERLEHLTFSAVTLGFALFTLGIVTGLGWILKQHWVTRLGPHWFLSPKVMLTFSVWVVFAIVLHTPIAPRLRGRKTAWLSIIGLLLTIATILAVLLTPTGGAD